MIFPSTSEMVLLLSLLSFICWGVWIATFKRTTPSWRFELYAFDFAIGVALTGVLVALTFGSLGDELSFTDNLLIARKRYLAFALLAGAAFNLANMLLLAAVSIAGVAVAFPISFGLALIIATLASGNLGGLAPALLWGGIALALVAVVCAILAYRKAVSTQHIEVDAAPVTLPKGIAKKAAKPTATKGIIVSVVSGLLMGAFFPLIGMARSSSTDFALGPYAIVFLLGVGVFLTTIIYNLYFINLPVYGEAVEFSAMLKGSFGTHLMGVIGGILWCSGLAANLVAYAAPAATATTQWTTFVLGQAGAVLAAGLGLLVWKEFKDSDVGAFPFLAIAGLIGALALIRFALP